MNIFEKLLYWLDGNMKTPTNYSWFHIMFIVIILTATILISYFFKNSSKKTFNKIMFIGWLIMFVFEIYKQLNFSFNYENGVVSWDYQWYAFPYQLCSTPLYVLPFIFLSKDGKLKDAMMSYMMTFSLFGGLAVFVYPNDVFIDTIGINIQTMVHHGLQIVLGIFAMVYNREKLNIHFWLKSLYVFSVLVSIALIANISMYHILKASGIDETFNMFYIGPYYDCSLPILSMIYPKIPYICFILLYILGFGLISFILYISQKGIYNLVKKYGNKQKYTN